MHIVCVHRGMIPERVGGTYTYIYEIYRRLAARGHRVEVIASTREPDPGPPREVEGVLVHRYGFRRLNPVASTLQHLAKTRRVYADIAARNPVDLLAIHESQLGYTLARSALGKAVCQVPTYHAPVFLEYRFNTAWEIRAARSPLTRVRLQAASRPLERWQRRFERGILEAADGIVVLSQYTRGIIRAQFPTVDLSKVTIIPSGVDSDRFRPAEDREAVRARFGIGKDTLELLTVRNLAPRMGLENLVRAMPDIVSASSSRGLRVGLTICGSGPLAAPLNALVRELGLAGVVSLAGRVTDGDLVARYQAADLFVLPTAAMEGFGISTVEALATNVPVVGTPAGATPEILAGIDGRLLTSDTSARAIADAVAGWLDWRAEDAGTTRYRDRVLAKYTWGRVTDEVETYYAERVEQFRRRRAAS